MNKAVFLDRDGTINVDKHYLHKIEEFEFLPGVLKGLGMLQDAGYLLIIVTNQSGIARGYYTEEDYLVVNDWMISYLAERKINISRVYYCPHLPGAEIEQYRKVCACRKPALGMYEKAVRDFNIDLSRSFAIGDKLRDCAICEKSGCRGYLIADNEKPEIIAAVKQRKYENIKYAADLLECAEEIIRMEKWK